jgi:hypothetical protein
MANNGNASGRILQASAMQKRISQIKREKYAIFFNN